MYNLTIIPSAFFFLCCPDTKLNASESKIEIVQIGCQWTV